MSAETITRNTYPFLPVQFEPGVFRDGAYWPGQLTPHDRREQNLRPEEAANHERVDRLVGLFPEKDIPQMNSVFSDGEESPYGKRLPDAALNFASRVAQPDQPPNRGIEYEGKITQLVRKPRFGAMRQLEGYEFAIKAFGVTNHCAVRITRKGGIEIISAYGKPKRIPTEENSSVMFAIERLWCELTAARKIVEAESALMKVRVLFRDVRFSLKRGIPFWEGVLSQLNGHMRSLALYLGEVEARKRQRVTQSAESMQTNRIYKKGLARDQVVDDVAVKDVQTVVQKVEPVRQILSDAAEGIYYINPESSVALLRLMDKYYFEDLMRIYLRDYHAYRYSFITKNLEGENPSIDRAIGEFKRQVSDAIRTVHTIEQQQKYNFPEFRKELSDDLLTVFRFSGLAEAVLEQDTEMDADVVGICELPITPEARSANRFKIRDEFLQIFGEWKDEDSFEEWKDEDSLVLDKDEIKRRVVRAVRFLVDITPEDERYASPEGEQPTDIEELIDGFATQILEMFDFSEDEMIAILKEAFPQDILKKDQDDVTTAESTKGVE